MRVRIKQFVVSKYSSCAKATFWPNADLSALIGRNASGKTNLLKAILLLKSLSRGPLHESSEDRTGSTSKLSVEFGIGAKTVSLRANVNHSTPQRNKESISFEEQSWNFRDFSGEDNWITWPIHLFGDEPMPYRYEQLRVLRNLPLDQQKSWVDFASKHLPKMLRVIKELRRFFQGISYYSASQFVDPSRSPASFQFEETSIERARRRTPTHSRFLHDLYSLYIIRETTPEYDEFMSIIGPKGLRLVQRIYFSKITYPQSEYLVRVGGSVVKQSSKTQLIIPVFKIDGNKLSPSQLSEGTFKTIALLFYLILDKGSLQLIEEPEVCVHHGLLTSIIELIKSYSSSKQIIISTHSDFILDSLDPENIFLVTNEQKRGTKVRALTNALAARDCRALKLYLSEEGNLGELWRHGGIEKDD